MAKKSDATTFSEVVDWRDVITRAGKTAVQTFIATTTVGAVVSTDVTSLQAALIAAASAAITVVWNAAAQWANS